MHRIFVYSQQKKKEKKRIFVQLAALLNYCRKVQVQVQVQDTVGLVHFGRDFQHRTWDLRSLLFPFQRCLNPISRLLFMLFWQGQNLLLDDQPYKSDDFAKIFFFFISQHKAWDLQHLSFPFLRFLEFYIMENILLQLASSFLSKQKHFLINFSFGAEPNLRTLFTFNTTLYILMIQLEFVLANMYIDDDEILTK